MDYNPISEVEDFVLRNSSWNDTNSTFPPLEEEVNPYKEYVPTYLYSAALTLSGISVFLRMGFLLKLGLMSLSVIAHITIFTYMDFFRDYQGIYSDL